MMEKHGFWKGFVDGVNRIVRRTRESPVMTTVFCVSLGAVAYSIGHSMAQRVRGNQSDQTNRHPDL